MVGTVISYDKRNNAANPTRGYYIEVANDFAGLGGDAQYWRVNAEGRFYYPITDKITFVGRAVGGVIQGWGGQDVRLLDSFFKGGETVRGFDISGFGPRDLSSSNQDALGGQKYWAATAEVRFPLPYIPDDIGLSGAVFADAGSLWDATGGAKSALSGCTSVRSSLPRRRQRNPIFGRRQLDLELAGRSAAYGLRQGPDEGELRPDAVLPLRRPVEVLAVATRDWFI